MRRDGRRNAAQFPVCEICGEVAWTSRVPDRVICGRCERAWRDRQVRATQAEKDLSEIERLSRGYEPGPLENPPDPEWEELDGVMAALHAGLRIDDLWLAVGAGDMTKALGLLDEHWELADDVTRVKVMAQPDDILGDLYRIWIK